MRAYHMLTMVLIMTIMLGACASATGPANVVPPGSDATPTNVATTGAPTATTSSESPADSSTPSSTQRVTIRFAAWDLERPIYEPLIARFEQENPSIRVNLVSLDSLINPGADPRQAMRKIVSAADTAVFVVTSADIKNGFVRDLTPLIDADPSFDRADFYPAVREAMRQEGGTYLLPRNLDVPLLSYNKDLWQAANLPLPTPDWRWQDLIAAAEQLTQKRGDTVTVHGLVAWNTSLTVLQGELAAAGLDLAAIPPEQVRFDQPVVEAALARAVALTKAGVLYIGESPYGDRQLILNQQVAIWPTETAFRGYPDTRLPFASGTVPFPTLPVRLEGYLMSSGAQDPQAAWRWLAFLSRQPITWALGDANVDTQVPARPSIAEQSRFWQQLDAETTAALRAVIARPVGPPLPDPDERITDRLYQALDAVLQGTQTPRQALRDAQAGLEQLALQPTPIAAPGLIVVATPEATAPPDAVTIRFGAPGISQGSWRQVASAFSQANPGIVVEIQSTSTMTGTLPLSTIAAQTDCFTGLGPPDSAVLPALLDLQPLIDADPTINLAGYPPALLAPFQAGKGLYGLPDEVYFRVLHYNPAAFDAAGLAYPSAAWTLEDLQHAARLLTHGTGARKQYGFALPGGVTGDQTPEVRFFLDRLGAALTTGSGSALAPQFTDPGVVAAVRSYVELVRATSPHAHLLGYRRDAVPDDVGGFITRGQVGMWFDFDLGFLGGASRPSFTHAIAPPPLGSSAITANDFRVRGLYISARATQPEACWTWLKFLSNQIVEAGWGVPARRSLAESQAFTRQAPPGAAELYQAYRAGLDRTSQSGKTIDWLEQSVIDDYWFFRAIDRALQGKDLERELADAQALTEQFLVCVRSGEKASDCARQVDPGYQGWR